MDVNNLRPCNINPVVKLRRTQKGKKIMNTITTVVNDILKAENNVEKMQLSVSNAVRMLNPLLPKWHETSLFKHRTKGNEDCKKFAKLIDTKLAVAWANKDEHTPKFGKTRIAETDLDLTITNVLWDDKQWIKKHPVNGAEIYSFLMSDVKGNQGVRREMFKYIGGRYSTWQKLAVDAVTPSATDDEPTTFEEQSEKNFTAQYKRIANAKSKGSCDADYAIEMQHAINMVLEINKKYMS